MTASLLPSTVSADGPGVWTSVGLEKDLPKGWSIGLEGEYRRQDGLSEMDRWSLGASVTGRIWRNSDKSFVLKGSLGYKYMQTFHPEKWTFKGYDDDDTSQEYPEYNVDEEYWLQRHRLYGQLQASQKFGRFKVSIRERFQLTVGDSVKVIETKLRYSNSYGGYVPWESSKTEEEWKGTTTSKSVLRSRLRVDYDVPNSKLSPFASIELYNVINDSFGLDKERYSVGASYTINKIHDFSLYYAYQSFKDDDESSNHLIGFSYTFTF